ncbi:MAG: hypothetical protein EBR58_04295, partial [Betaproteobacteria bacterium]|nr:hypothetical protein [Betaproteobacteria bacterium]
MTTITISGGDSNLTLPGNIDTIMGGTGADTITISSQLTDVSNTLIDLGSGTDSLTLGNFANTGTIANIESVTGNSGVDQVTLSTTLTAGQINLGAGTADKVTLANGTNSLTATGVETINGGTGADTLTLGDASTAGQIDLGAGADVLNLGNFANTLTVKNTES